MFEKLTKNILKLRIFIETLEKFEKFLENLINSFIDFACFRTTLLTLSILLVE